MRRALLLLSSVFCLLSSVALAGPMTPSEGVKTVTTAGTPVALVASATYVAAVAIYPSKNTTTANTGNILIGFVAGAGNQKLPLSPTSPPFVISAEEGKTINLATIYLDAATSADGVVWVALSR